MTGAAFLDIDRVAVRYGPTQVLHDLSLGVGRGEFVALLGSSGCGKTTLLRTIAGFLKPVAGRLRVDSRDITGLAPDRRGMAMVFQSYALWPHMSVAQNIGYGLKLRRLGRPAIAAKVQELLAMLGLEGLAERNVTALSGGQRQRVALGRALAVDPEILLLDEPLSNLDARIRQTVRHEIRALQRRLQITAIHVTHDREEAMVMADRIVILDAGRIAQAGAPETIYNHPASPFVADFLGADNSIELSAELDQTTVAIAAGADHAAARLARELLPTAAALPGRGGRRLRAQFRSEAAALEDSSGSDEAPADALVLTGRVSAVSYPGGVWRHEVAIGDRLFLVDATERHAPGSDVRMRLPVAQLFLFPAEAHAPEAAAPTTVTQ
jgi:ABC-type Fe3+/spermidine/putrescine transport system ATPase subunit